MFFNLETNCRFKLDRDSAETYIVAFLIDGLLTSKNSRAAAVLKNMGNAKNRAAVFMIVFILHLILIEIVLR